MGLVGQNSTFYKIARAICRPISMIVFPHKFANRNTLPETGGYVIACNHISDGDPVLLGLGQKRQMNFMAKAELFKFKPFAFIISHLGAFPVQRNSGDNVAINRGMQVLKEGGVMTIFIEGTRSKNGELLRPRSGAAMVAYNAGVPIVPCSITIKGGRISKPFRMRTVRYGEPMSLSDLGLVNGTPREFRDASRTLMTKISQMREMDL